MKVFFGYRKNTYQRQTDRFLIRNTEDNDVIRNGSRPDGGGVEPRPSATPKYDMYMSGAQMAGAQIKRAQITSKTNRWLHKPFVYYRFSLQFILLVVFDREDALSVKGIILLEEDYLIQTVYINMILVLNLEVTCKCKNMV